MTRITTRPEREEAFLRKLSNAKWESADEPSLIAAIPGGALLVVIGVVATLVMVAWS